MTTKPINCISSLGRCNRLTCIFALTLAALVLLLAQDVDGASVGKIKSARDRGCYYSLKHFKNGDQIQTEEPCLNCTCENSMLMCYLRVCPYVKPIGDRCIIERVHGECCPRIICPEIGSTSGSNESTSEQQLEPEAGDLNATTLLDSNNQQVSQPSNTSPSPGCTLGDKHYHEGAQMPSDPSKPCEICYCIKNASACVMQDCALEVGGCSPVYSPGGCCPTRYNCTTPNSMFASGMRDAPTAGSSSPPRRFWELPSQGQASSTPPTTTSTSTTTSTTTSMPFAYPDFGRVASQATPTSGCRAPNSSRVYAEGARVQSKNKCEHCYCMRSEIVCAVLECRPPCDGCTPINEPNQDECCPKRYECVAPSRRIPLDKVEFVDMANATSSASPPMATVDSAERPKPLGVESRAKVGDELGSDETNKSTESPSNSESNQTKQQRPSSGGQLKPIAPKLSGNDEEPGDLPQQTSTKSPTHVDGFVLQGEREQETEPQKQNKLATDSSNAPDSTSSTTTTNTTSNQTDEGRSSPPAVNNVASPEVVGPSSEQTDRKPALVPGEGSCRYNGKIYMNGQEVKPKDKCMELCTCVNGVVYCDEVDCPRGPENQDKCQRVIEKGECCPKFVCEDDNTTSTSTTTTSTTTPIPTSTSSTTTTTTTVVPPKENTISDEKFEASPPSSMSELPPTSMAPQDAQTKPLESSSQAPNTAVNPLPSEEPAKELSPNEISSPAQPVQTVPSVAAVDPVEAKPVETAVILENNDKSKQEVSKDQTQPATVPVEAQGSNVPSSSTSQPSNQSEQSITDGPIQPAKPDSAPEVASATVNPTGTEATQKQPSSMMDGSNSVASSDNNSPGKPVVSQKTGVADSTTNSSGSDSAITLAPEVKSNEPTGPSIITTTTFASVVVNSSTNPLDGSTNPQELPNSPADIYQVDKANQSEPPTTQITPKLAVDTTEPTVLVLQTSKPTEPQASQPQDPTISTSTSTTTTTTTTASPVEPSTTLSVSLTSAPVASSTDVSNDLVPKSPANGEETSSQPQASQSPMTTTQAPQPSTSGEAAQTNAPAIFDPVSVSTAEANPKTESNVANEIPSMSESPQVESSSIATPITTSTTSASVPTSVASVLEVSSTTQSDSTQTGGDNAARTVESRSKTDQTSSSPATNTQITPITEKNPVETDAKSPPVEVVTEKPNTDSPAISVPVESNLKPDSREEPSEKGEPATTIAPSIAPSTAPSTTELPKASYAETMTTIRPMLPASDLVLSNNTPIEPVAMANPEVVSPSDVPQTPTSEAPKPSPTEASPVVTAGISSTSESSVEAKPDQQAYTPVSVSISTELTDTSSKPTSANPQQVDEPKTSTSPPSTTSTPTVASSSESSSDANMIANSPSNNQPVDLNSQPEVSADKSKPVEKVDAVTTSSPQLIAENITKEYQPETSSETSTSSASTTTQLTNDNSPGSSTVSTLETVEKQPGEANKELAKPTLVDDDSNKVDKNVLILSPEPKVIPSSTELIQPKISSSDSSVLDAAITTLRPEVITSNDTIDNSKPVSSSTVSSPSEPNVVQTGNMTPPPVDEVRPNVSSSSGIQPELQPAIETTVSSIKPSGDTTRAPVELIKEVLSSVAPNSSESSTEPPTATSNVTEAIPTTITSILLPSSTASDAANEIPLNVSTNDSQPTLDISHSQPQNEINTTIGQQVSYPEIPVQNIATGPKLEPTNSANKTMDATTEARQLVDGTVTVTSETKQIETTTMVSSTSAKNITDAQPEAPPQPQQEDTSQTSTTRSDTSTSTIAPAIGSTSSSKANSSDTQVNSLASFDLTTMAPRAMESQNITLSPGDEFAANLAATSSSASFKPVEVTTSLGSIRGSPVTVTIPWSDISNNSTQTAEASPPGDSSELASSTKTTSTTTTEPTTTRNAPIESTTAQPTTSRPNVSGNLRTNQPLGASNHENATNPDYNSGNNATDSDYEDVTEDTGCEYEGKSYNSAQQIPKSNPCEFCFCFRGDIICLQQTCPPPVPHCFESIVEGFCCPRYECPVHTVRSSPNSTALALTPYDTHSKLHNSGNSTDASNKPSNNSPKGSVRGCFVENKLYGVGQTIDNSVSGPCMECLCDRSGMMKCNPKECSPEDPLIQQINGEVLRSTMSRNQRRRK